MTYQSNHERGEVAQLVALLARLIRVHGWRGTATKLGVSHSTLRRDIRAKALGSKLRLALKRYRLLEQGAAATSREQLLVTIADLFMRIGALEERLRHMGGPFEGDGMQRPRTH